MAVANKAEVKDFEKPREYEQHGNESIGGGQRAREMGVSKPPLSGLYSRMFLLMVFTMPWVPRLWNPGNERVGGEEVVGFVCENVLLLASNLKGGRKSDKKICGKEKKEVPGQNRRKGPLVAEVGEKPRLNGVRKGVRSWDLSAAVERFPETG